MNLTEAILKQTKASTTRDSDLMGDKLELKDTSLQNSVLPNVTAVASTKAKDRISTSPGLEGKGLRSETEKKSNKQKETIKSGVVKGVVLPYVMQYKTSGTKNISGQPPQDRYQHGGRSVTIDKKKSGSKSSNKKNNEMRMKSVTHEEFVQTISNIKKKLEVSSLNAVSKSTEKPLTEKLVDPAATRVPESPEKIPESPMKVEQSPEKQVESPEKPVENIEK